MVEFAAGLCLVVIMGSFAAMMVAIAAGAWKAFVSDRF